MPLHARSYLYAVSLVIGLAGCTDEQVQTEPAESEAAPASVVVSCPKPPPAILAPAPPRTFDSVVVWAELVEQRRAETARIANLCRDRLNRIQEPK